ncbi:helix-turn-helix transcriptional regulator [Methylobacterium sp.]|uniref:helix-turn-helix domain-containing protein n=1 Tax=Methylobacterium sp. TaxID=409 RepID=UPI000C41B0FF|nr:helix-turn-helix transcriptional regulator [Methylobacterium sp.]MBP33033.1 transcriptional regulator [Methylobacterium sp.]
MIAPGQCRAARALLNLSQKQLADAAGVSLRTVQGFERGDRTLHRLAMNAIERVLNDKGIVLITQTDWIGVKLKTSGNSA